MQKGRPLACSIKKRKLGPHDESRIGEIFGNRGGTEGCETSTSPAVPSAIEEWNPTNSN